MKLNKLEKTTIFARYMVAVCFIFLLAFTVLISNCAPVKGLSKEQSNLLRFYNFYNTQYYDYENMTKNPENLSEEKKMILRKKKEMLIELHRLIKLYEFQTSLDITDNVETEQMIYDLLNNFE